MTAHATLRDANIYTGHGDTRIRGRIYGDLKGRFEDGEMVITSPVLDELPGDIVQTKNSIYKVEWQRHTLPANDNHDTAADINAFVALTHGASSAAGWWNEPGTGIDLRTNPYVIGTKIGLIHSEISEAMEGHRKGAMDDHLPHRKSIEVELADAMIRIGDMAGVLGLDLGGAIVEKMAYNARRADHKMDNRAATGGKVY
jgi:NTP pyrophosphatase (non-canonical NTP hydrolase)